MATVRQSHIPIHPDCHIVDDQTGPLLKLQLILSQPSSKLIHPDAAWPIENEESMMATRGLTHVAHINCVVWISSQLIVGLISVFHTSDCINHTYGAITGREYAYFTCSNAVYLVILIPSLSFIQFNLYCLMNIMFLGPPQIMPLKYM